MRDDNIATYFNLLLIAAKLTDQKDLIEKITQLNNLWNDIKGWAEKAEKGLL